MSDASGPAIATPAMTRRQLFGRLGAVGATALATSLGACTASPSQAPSSADSSPAPAVPKGSLDVRHFGATGDGRTDDTAALLRALGSLHTGQTLVLPRGTYRHSRVLPVTTDGVTLQGPGRLYATAEQTSALRIDAPGVTVRDMIVAMGPTTQRWSSDDQHKIFLAPHDGIVVEDVHIEGSAAAGLFCYGAQHFRFLRVQVSDTRADGIHMTNGSAHGVVERPTIMRSGDDGVAVVSYSQDPGTCHDITVTSPRVLTTTGGRGISVVGGRDVVYRDIRIDRSDAASVYLACEGGDFVTRDTEWVTVQGGTITDANTDSGIDHGAVLVYCGRPGGAVRHISVSGLTVRGTRLTASRQIGAVADGPDDVVSDVSLTDLDLAGAPTPYQGDAPTSGVELHAVRAAGVAVTDSP